MAEKIVSPGVFTEEKDLSFLPQGIGEIGAAFVGPTVKGPAFVPTIVESGNEFIQKFGPTKDTMYTPYAVQNYLKNSGKATIVRTLGLDGYTAKHPIYVRASGSYGYRLISVLHPTFVATNADTVSYFEQSTLTNGSAAGDAVLTISGSYTTDTSTFTNATDKNGTAYSASIDPEDSAYLGDLFGYLPTGIEPVYNYVLFGTNASASIAEDSNTNFDFVTGSATVNGHLQMITKRRVHLGLHHKKLVETHKTYLSSITYLTEHLLTMNSKYKLKTLERLVQYQELIMVLLI